MRGVEDGNRGGGVGGTKEEEVGGGCVAGIKDGWVGEGCVGVSEGGGEAGGDWVGGTDVGDGVEEMGALECVGASIGSGASVQ